MANAEHKDEWITAAEAVRLLKPIFESGYSAKMTICSRAHAGLIRARAEHFMRIIRCVAPLFVLAVGASVGAPMPLRMLRPPGR